MALSGCWQRKTLCRSTLSGSAPISVGATSRDVLAQAGRDPLTFESPRQQTRHTHGTGCTFASAIAAHLARGKSVSDAVQTAKNYLTEAIRNGLAIGHGQGPTNHFYFLNP